MLPDANLKAAYPYSACHYANNPIQGLLLIPLYDTWLRN